MQTLPDPRKLGTQLARAVRQFRASTDPAVAAAWLAVIRRLTDR